MPRLPVYLDCNATTPMEEEVTEAMVSAFRTDFGNAGSRTHRFGTSAAQALRKAREQIAQVVQAEWDNVLFTSGATESNNLALLGLASSPHLKAGRHIISTEIEHKAILEPLEHLKSLGLEVTLVPPEASGVVDPEAIRNALRPETCLVSVAHVNNETGAIQQLDAIADVLSDHAAVLHTDAAQSFGKEFDGLNNLRVDLISVTAHKIYGPKGIGALIVRPSDRVPRLKPLMFGGGQERGIRPGTVPVPLAVGFGVAAELSLRDRAARRNQYEAFRNTLIQELAPVQPTYHGDIAHTLPNVLNMRFGEIDSEAIMLALKDYAAISNGSACNSNSYEPSHVLKAMKLSDGEADAATRWSWSHRTPQPDWSAITSAIRQLY